MKKGITGMAVLLIILTLAAVPVFAAGNRQARSGTGKVIELFETGWSTTPIEPPDPYNDYVNSLSEGYTWKLTTPADFTSELTTRAAAGDMPDVIVFNSQQLLFSIYNQGILLDDWNSYKGTMPKTFNSIGDIQMKYYTVNNKLICVPTKGGDRDWSFMIRKDWLDKLGLSIPTTPEEFIAVGQAFTTRDPDGNGRNDTYGFTSAGAGESLGEIANVGIFFGPTGYYVENNTVRHPITDGNYKLTLDMVKKMVDLQIIDPDWYTRGWQERKPDLFQGKFGIAWYPPDALLSETEAGRGDGLVENWYAPIAPLPKGSAKGGRLPSTTPFGTIRTASVAASKDTAKMAIIAKILDNFALPGIEYWKLLRGYQIDKYDMVDLNGSGYFNQGPISAARGSRAGSHEGQNFGLWNWNQWISVNSPEGLAYQGSTDEPTSITYNAVAMGAQLAALPHYSGEAALLNLNNDNTQQAASVQSEFAIRYILGQDTDYNGFVRRWLSAGGQALLDEATQQLKGYGVIK
jgi:putative aldouronate transport system substrate-binding protein